MCHPSFCSIIWNLRVQIRSPFLNQGTQGYIGTHIIDTNALLKLPNDAKNTGWLSWPRLGYNGATNSCKIVTAYLQHSSRCTKLHLHKKELESIWSIQLLGPERERALHWRYSSKCIRFLGPIHSVFCTLYKNKKTMHTSRWLKSI